MIYKLKRFYIYLCESHILIEQISYQVAFDNYLPKLYYNIANKVRPVYQQTYAKHIFNFSRTQKSLQFWKDNINVFST